MIIRKAVESDLASIHKLADQLGYPQFKDEIFPRLIKILHDPKQRILVAENNEIVISWIHFGEGHSLVDPEYIEIRGLVVDERLRSNGIGRAMMAEVENYARQLRFSRIRFSSNTLRERAHKLYVSLGYEVQKTSYQFIKKLK